MDGWPRAIALEGPGARQGAVGISRRRSPQCVAANYPVAKQMLDDALATLGGIYGKDPNAKKARSYFTAENKKTFIGEPYERVMAYYYRGILYWMDGEPDNARACFRTGQLEDSSSEGEQYNADYVLLDYLDGLATTKLGDDEKLGRLSTRGKIEQAIRQAAALRQTEECAVVPGVQSRPEKIRRRSLSRGIALHPACPNRWRILPPRSRVENQIVQINPYDDLGFQATTRGGRARDGPCAGEQGRFQDHHGCRGQRRHPRRGHRRDEPQPDE